MGLLIVNLGLFAKATEIIFIQFTHGCTVALSLIMNTSAMHLYLGGTTSIDVALSGGLMFLTQRYCNDFQCLEQVTHSVSGNWLDACQWVYEYI